MPFRFFSIPRPRFQSFLSATTIIPIFHLPSDVGDDKRRTPSVYGSIRRIPFRALLLATSLYLLSFPPEVVSILVVVQATTLLFHSALFYQHVISKNSGQANFSTPLCVNDDDGRRRGRSLTTNGI